MAELSPMMKQYFEIKENNKDSILFFRLGDFYEMFFDDAKLASRELDLTLTGRDCGQEERAPMCGVPFHSCEGYIQKLVAKGYKVAICEQTQNPAEAKGLVKRDVIRVITPGTVVESGMLDESKNNYIASLYSDGSNAGICFCDVSTGQLYATELSGKTVADEIKSQLISYNPHEILLGGTLAQSIALGNFIEDKLIANVEKPNEDNYTYLDSFDTILKHFGPKKSEKLKDQQMTVLALGALISYLYKTQMTGLERISDVELYSVNQYMKLDFNTRRNLELTQTMLTKEKRGSLLWVLDKTRTAMGKRLMRSWIEQPLMNAAAIIRRHTAVEELLNNTVKRLEITAALTGILDIQRIMTKIVFGSANARELRSLAAACAELPAIKSLLEDSTSSYLKELYKSLDTLEDIYALIDNAIVDEPPFTVREGGMIKEGFNPELDSVRFDMTGSTSLLAQIEAGEREKTGIPKLKVGYNRVFGYFIEVTNSYKELVPETYIRKQTLANCERYMTQELKDLEARILGAKDKSVAMEYEIFTGIRKTVADNLARIEVTTSTIATLDVLCSLSNVASDNNFVRPDITLSSTLRLKNSRHPVVEALLKNSMFVPNDVFLDCEANRVAIITGPNMAGKSTYMRQVALIVLMAQMGSFVPCESAEIGIVDAIYTRVGASDDLAAGQSTFMVEMSEVANIVKNATQKSLLVFDEIGRGTSTFDGMSIARAVLEYVVNKKHLGAKTLFATHYHELTVLESLMEGVKNYNIAVKKRGDDITFLRKIVKGGADESYGIEVAKLAGIPESIIRRAKEILKELTLAEPDEVKAMTSKINETESQQLTLLNPVNDVITEKLNKVDINTLTPIEAINLIYELKKLL
ncbi:MAG: DNA mismatch repair protein MutS [Ruminococcus sp.]|nr:DNA mismatch repair protein MutS [Ruminococcus sp.]